MRTRQPNQPLCLICPPHLCVPAKTRGLCGIHYNQARERISKKLTSWEFLELWNEARPLKQKKKLNPIQELKLKKLGGMLPAPGGHLIDPRPKPPRDYNQ